MGSALDIEKISTNVFRIVIGKYPRKLPDIDYYRGDVFSLTLLGENLDGTPFDFSIADKFEMQFRVGNARNVNVLAEFGPENFVLGKTDEEQEEFDELHMVDTTGQKLLTKSKTIVTDVMYFVNDEPYTLAFAKVPIKFDVTRSE